MQLPPVASLTLLPQSPESTVQTGCGLDPGPRPGQLGLFAFCLVNQANHVGLERGILATSLLGLYLPHHHRCWALWAGRDQFLPWEPGLPTWVVSVGPKTVGLASVLWVMDGVSY